jgi:hypothetical protein
VKLRSSRGTGQASVVPTGPRASAGTLGLVPAVTAPPSARKCAEPSLLDNGIGTAKSQCEWSFLGDQEGSQKSIALRTDNEPFLCQSASRPQGRDADSLGLEVPSGACDLDGEFDPGSGRTLAACLTHASRTESIRWQHR